MRRVRACLIIGVFCALIFPTSSFADTRLIVRYKSPQPYAEMAAQARSEGGRVVRRFAHGHTAVILAPDDKPGQLNGVIRELRSDSEIQRVEKDRWVAPLTVPSLGEYSGLWGMNRIDTPEAWGSTTGEGVVVAVIDTGVQYTHPDLAANMWSNSAEIAGNGVDDDSNGYVDDVRGWDFYAQDNNAMDESGHGTHVAGTIAAVANGQNIVGVAPDAQIMPLRFLGPFGGYESDAAAAIYYATDNGAWILNNSWGGGGGSAELQYAINYAKANDVLFVAAAGNSGVNADVNPMYPAALPQDNILSVAATSNPGSGSDYLAYFSNYGATSVDMAAPGQGIYSTYPTSTYASLSGTSMATPHVAGAAALLWSSFPDATYSEIKAALMDGGEQKASLAGTSVSGAILNVPGSLLQMGVVPNPVAVTPPSITASYTADGGTLSCQSGTWKGKNLTFDYEWSRNGDVVDGADTQTLDFTNPQLEDLFQCTVTATNSAATSVSATSSSFMPLPVPAGGTATIDTPSYPGVGRTISCSTSGWTNGTIDIAYAWYRSGTAIAGETSQQYTMTSADNDNSVYCRVTASNAKGSSQSTSFYYWPHWTIATKFPAVPSVVSRPSTFTTTPNADVSFSSKDKAALFYCSYDNSTYSVCESPLQTDSADDGAYNLYIKQRDQSGNYSSPAVLSWTLDTTAPASIDIAYDLSPTEKTPNPGSMPAYSKASVTLVFSQEAGTVLKCSLNSADKFNTCPTRTTFKGLKDGVQTVRAYQTDLAGNQSAVASVTWTADTKAPAALVLSSKPDILSNSAAPEFAWTEESGSTAECAVDSNTPVTCNGGKTFEGLSEGAHTFLVYQVDQAGNQSAKTTWKWKKDTIAPSAPTLPNLPSNYIKSSLTVPKISGEKGAAITCSLDEATYAACPKSLASLSDGEHTLRVRQMDPAGNISSPYVLSWTSDSTAPETPALDSKPASGSTSKTPSFSWTGEESAVFRCILDSSKAKVLPNCASPYTTPALKAGVHTIYFQQVDRSGNLSPIGQYSWTVAP